MEAWPWLVAILMVMAGCAGAIDGDGTPLRQADRPDGPTGTLQGVVTDAAIQPIQGVNVTIVEADRTVQTTSDGSYLAQAIPPGTYTVHVRADGYISARETVEITAGEVTILDLLLERLDEEVAYTQTFEKAGYIEQGLGVSWNITPDVPFGRFGFRQIACGVQGGQNCSASLDLEGPLTELVVEVVWDPNTPTSDELGVAVSIVADQGWHSLNWTDTESPARIVVDEAHLEAAIESYREACEEGEDRSCGFSPRENGWPIRVAIWPSGGCQIDTASACVAFQQSYTVFAGAFYHTPAPQGYSLATG